MDPILLSNGKLRFGIIKSATNFKVIIQFGVNSDKTLVKLKISLLTTILLVHKESAILFRIHCATLESMKRP